MDRNLVDEIIVIMLWIGVWGIIQNITDKYIPEKKYNVRILLYSGIFILSLIFIFRRNIFD